MNVDRRHQHAGFTLIDLMIVVAIIGLLSAVAIPNYMRFQLKTKSSEAKSNLAAISAAEEAYFAEFGRYVAATAEPGAIPGTQAGDFSRANLGFNTLGFMPEGRVFFSYGVATDAAVQHTGYSADAGADIDGNALRQYWGFTKAASDGSFAMAVVGCDVTAITPQNIAPCTAESGQSVF